MTARVVDASVAVKWLFTEEHTEAARRLLLTPGTLHAPELMLLEVRNAIVKRKRRNEINILEARRLGAAISQFPVSIISDADLRDVAFELALNESISLYDALYVSLAVFLEGQVVTADERLYRSISRTPNARRVLWLYDVAG